MKDASARFWLRTIRFVIKDSPEFFASATKMIASILRIHQGFDEDQAWTLLVADGIRYRIQNNECDDPSISDLMKLYEVKEKLCNEVIGIRTARQLQDEFGVERYTAACLERGLDPRQYDGDLPKGFIVNEYKPTEAMRILVEEILSDDKLHRETDIIMQLEQAGAITSAESDNARRGMDISILRKMASTERFCGLPRPRGFWSRSA